MGRANAGRVKVGRISCLPSMKATFANNMFDQDEAQIKALGLAGFEHAMVALLQRGPRAVPALLVAATGGGAKASRAVALLRVQIDVVLPRLQVALQAPEANTIAWAIAILDALGEAYTLARLREAHASGSVEQMAAALRPLGVIENPLPLLPLVAAAQPTAQRIGVVVPPLIALLGHRERAVVAAAIGALWSLRDPRAILPLIALLTHADEGIRSRAISALGALSDPRAVAPLLQVAEDAALPPALRAKAITALGQLAEPHIVPRLSALLPNADADLTVAIYGSLGNIGDPQALPTLLGGLAARDSWIRINAARAIGHLGDPGALPVLRAQIREPRRVRKAIRQAIIHIVREYGPRQRAARAERMRALEQMKLRDDITG
jgi:hypothetical protein